MGGRTNEDEDEEGKSGKERKRHAYFFYPPPPACTSPPSRAPPLPQDADSEHESLTTNSEDGVRVEAEESEIEEIWHE
jgi:hypothetical protein